MKNLWKESPVEASYFGIHDYDDLLDSYSSDSVDDYLNRRKSYLAQLKSFSQEDEDLTPYQLDNLSLLVDKFSWERLMLEDYELHLKDPVLYLDTILEGLFILTIRESIPIQKRMKNIENRLRLVPRFLEEARSNLKINSRDVPPLWIDIANEHARAGLQFIESSIPTLAEGISDCENRIQEASGIAGESIRSFSDFLEEEIRRRASGDYFIGEEMFGFLLNWRHRLSQSPSDLIEMAERTIEEVEREMRHLARGIKQTEDWSVVVEELKNVHPHEDSVLEAYTDEVKRLKEFLQEKDLVTLPDGENLNIVETPVFMRSLIPYAAYISPGPFEDDLDGFFLVTAPQAGASEEQTRENLQGHNSYGLPITSLHEGYPGHHLQLVISNMVSRGIRKIFTSSLFAEGWALYCEEMMHEEGYYNDPGIRLMQLKDLLWRACRVVIDIRLHSGDLDFEGAVDMLVEVARLEKSNAIAEVKRYTRSPTQPLTYLTGKLEILKFRDRLMSEKQDQFDLKSFHDQLLSYGTVPLDIISRQMV
jgi:hypothetical protein